MGKRVEETKYYLKNVLGNMYFTKTGKATPHKSEAAKFTRKEAEKMWWRKANFANAVNLQITPITRKITK